MSGSKLCSKASILMDWRHPTQLICSVEDSDFRPSGEKWFHRMSSEVRSQSSGRTGKIRRVKVVRLKMVDTDEGPSHRAINDPDSPEILNESQVFMQSNEN